MVLADFMGTDPSLGPHPVVAGTSSLQWNDVDPDAVNTIRNAYGLPNVTEKA